MAHQHLANILDTDPALRDLADAGDVEGIVEAVNVADRERTNHELQTTLAIVVRHGAEFAATALGVLKAASAVNPLLDGIYIKLCSTGIDFADPLTQGMIDVVFTGDFAAMAAPLKQMGVWQESLADQLFPQTDIDAAFVELTLVLYERRKLERLASARYSDVIAMIGAGEITTWEAARTALGGE